MTTATVDQLDNILVLSPNARTPKPDVVIWNPKNRVIMFAIRLHQKSHITLSTVYRWMSEARKRGPGCNHVGRRNYSEFLLYPVNIKALTGISSFLEYGVMGHGNPLPRVSTDVLQPGVYGAFLPDLRSCYLPMSTETTSSMLDIIEYAFECDWRDWTTASVEDITDFNKLQIRDQTCMTSGLSDDTISLWIVPPVGALFPVDDVGRDYETFEAVMRDELNREKVDISRFKSVTNIMIMRSDLAKLFYENKFSIDVDDNYRIVFFQDTDELECSSESMDALNARDYHWTQPIPDGAFQPDKDLLRRHFRHSLRVNLCGNDIHFHLTRNQIQTYWDRFNGHSDHDDIIRPTDPEWDTPLGRCCREWQRLDKVAELDERRQELQMSEEED